MDLAIINTERLFLHRGSDDDINEVNEYFADPEVRRYLGGYPPAHLSQIDKRRHRWYVALRDSGKLIGECHFNSVIDDCLAEIGYIFNRRYWGQGYAGEAIKAVVQYGFNNMNLGRIRAVVEVGNNRSTRLLQRLGFFEEATIEEYDFGGAWRMSSFFQSAITSGYPDDTCAEAVRALTATASFASY